MWSGFGVGTNVRHVLKQRVQLNGYNTTENTRHGPAEPCYNSTGACNESMGKMTKHVLSP